MAAIITRQTQKQRKQKPRSRHHAGFLYRDAGLAGVLALGPAGARGTIFTRSSFAREYYERRHRESIIIFSAAHQLFHNITSCSRRASLTDCFALLALFALHAADHSYSKQSATAHTHVFLKTVFRITLSALRMDNFSSS